MYKLFVCVALLAVASAEYQATSYSTYNDNHNSVHHIESASALTIAKYAAPAASIYGSPVLPAVAKVALPAIPVAKYVAPVAKVAPVVYSAPVAQYAPVPAYSAHKEEYAPAKYEFAYGIQDGHTGDFHSQEEHRDGDHVVGQYSLHEADGTVRIVKYSDEGHGFNAVVEKEGHPTEAPIYKKVVAVAAPHYGHY